MTPEQALRELVALKDQKDAGGANKEYRARKDAAWANARTALASAPRAVPVGWKPVPVEPTEEMIAAAYAASWEGGVDDQKMFAGICRAAVKAAPLADDVGVTDMRDGCYKCGGTPRPKLIRRDGWIVCEKCGGSYGAATPEAIAHLTAPPAPDPAGRVDLSEVPDQTRGLLLNLLWHHQGGGSVIGQTIRRMCGIGQHDRLTDEQVSEAKRIEGLIAWAEAPDPAGDPRPAEQRDRANALAARLSDRADWNTDPVEVIKAIELGLLRGYTPAEILDENSPVRDAIRMLASSGGPLVPVREAALVDALTEITGLSTALRQGGPAPDDLQELSDALERATDIAHDALRAAGQPEPRP